MRKPLLLLGSAALGAALLIPAAAANASTQVTYYETDTSTQFTPACNPYNNPQCDPRGPGSVLYSQGILANTQGGAQVGTISTTCTTVSENSNGDYYGTCSDVLSTPLGTLTLTGVIDESALERNVPQQLSVSGAATGQVTIQQIVYPNQFQLTFQLN